MNKKIYTPLCFMLFILLMTVGCLLMPLPVRAQSLVSLQDGRLVYNTYANKGQQNSVNKIPISPMPAIKVVA